MNKNLIFKGVALHSFIFAFCVSVCIANSTVIPVAVCLALVPAIKKLVNSMSEEDLHKVFLIEYLQSKFLNNPVIMDMTKE